MRSGLIAFCLVLHFWCGAAVAQGPAEIQQIADTMVRLCLGGGRAEAVTGGGTGGADLSLRSLDVTGNIKGEFKVSRSSAEGLVEGINNALTQVAANEADRVRTCLQPLRERLLDILLPVPSPGNRPRALGTVVQLAHLPKVSDQGKTDERIIRWINDFFNNAFIIIDKGAHDGVERGDYFVSIVDEVEVKSIGGDILGVLQEEGSTIKAVDVHAKFSLCQLVNLTYVSYSKNLEKRLKEFADKQENIDLNKHVELLSPFTIGQKVISLPKAEKEQWEEIEDIYRKTISENISRAEKAIRYKDMSHKADIFISRHPEGYFAPSVLFQKGYAQFQLGAYRDSINTFEQFLSRYPFHVSAPGAREWIVKAKKLARD
jgi:tetratricopeptide (TPR) repeat protein